MKKRPVPKLEKPKIVTSFGSIDKDRLDEEWAEQSDRVQKLNEELAGAKADHAWQKDRLEVIEAEVERDARINPEEFGLDKVTDKSVEAAVKLSLRVQRQKVRVIEAKYKADMIEAATKSLEHRKKALEDLTYLHSTGYWASPRAKSGPAKREMDDAKLRRTYRRLHDEEV